MAVLRATYRHRGPTLDSEVGDDDYDNDDDDDGDDDDDNVVDDDVAYDDNDVGQVASCRAPHGARRARSGALAHSKPGISARARTPACA